MGRTIPFFWEKKNFVMLIPFSIRGVRKVKTNESASIEIAKRNKIEKFLFQQRFMLSINFEIYGTCMIIS